MASCTQSCKAPCILIVHCSVSFSLARTHATKVTSTYLNESEDLLYKWRADVEAQGCQLINAVMFRDPLNHAMSLWKIIDHKNATAGEWLDHLKSPSESVVGGPLNSVQDSFLKPFL